MKKTILVMFMCLCSYAVMATSPINVGIHGGISSTKIKLKEIPTALTSRSNTGWMVGAFMRVNLGLLYVEPSLNFTHRESELDSKVGNGNLKVNSFDIPVMLGFNILDISLFKLRAYLGPVASFPGKLKSTIQDLADLDTDNVMWNGKVGIGVDVWKVTFDVDYEKGFKEFGHDVKAPRSFNFTLGLKFI